MHLNQNSSVLISGGASGLGEACVRRLHASNTSVVFLDLPGSRGEALANELGKTATFVPGDVTDEQVVAQAVKIAGEVGDLRASITCAGIATPGRLLGRDGPLDLAACCRVLEVNVIGTINVLRLAAQAIATNQIVAGERGVVIMTASIAAYDGQIGQAAYAASKGAIAALTISAARDLADKAIRVMTIAPGTFETPLLAGLPADARTVLEQQVPHPSRLGQPAEFADLAAHILANPMLNGEVIRLDGALRMPPR